MKTTVRMIGALLLAGWYFPGYHFIPSGYQRPAHTFSVWGQP
jgi:hypothetical protein